jgi:hypothetical protein
VESTLVSNETRARVIQEVTSKANAAATDAPITSKVIVEKEGIRFVTEGISKTAAGGSTQTNNSQMVGTAENGSVVGNVHDRPRMQNMESAVTETVTPKRGRPSAIKRCPIPGCTGVVEELGLCLAHAAQMKTGTAPKVEEPKALCPIPGCGRVIDKRELGLCKFHAKLMQAGADANSHEAVTEDELYPPMEYTTADGKKPDVNAIDAALSAEENAPKKRGRPPRTADRAPENVKEVTAPKKRGRPARSPEEKAKPRQIKFGPRP